MQYKLTLAMDELPRRERELLVLASRGKTDKEISLELGISRDTVGSYWRRILLRFGAASRTEVVARVAEQEIEAKLSEAERESARLLNEVTARAAAEAQVLAERNQLSAIADASLGYIAGAAEPKKVFAQLLAELLQLTDSEHGLIGEVRHDSEAAPYLDALALTAPDGVAQPAEMQFRDANTPLGRSLVTGQVQISQGTARDPGLADMPAGHFAFESYLGLPVKVGDEVVGLIGLANRPGGFDQALVDSLQPIALTCGTIIRAEAAERRRREAETAKADTVVRLMTLMDQLSSSVLFEDEHRRVMYVNRPFLELFQVPMEPVQVVGLDCRAAAEVSAQLFAEPGAFLLGIERVLAADEPVRDEPLVLADGRTLYRSFTPIRVEGLMRGYLWHYRVGPL